VYVISLSTIPARFGTIGLILENLLSQAVRPETVRLYTPRRYRRFPDWDGTLPAMPSGVDVRRPDEDLGPATKVLFAADELYGQDLRILFCDDDRIYLPDWSTRLLRAADSHPGAAIVSTGYQLEQIGLGYAGPKPAPRAISLSKRWDMKYHLQRLRQNIVHGGRRKVPTEVKAPRNLTARSGFVDVGEGFGGFLVRPEHFDRSAWDIPKVMWAVDDVWLSGQLAIKGVGIWAEAGASRFHTTPIQKNQALYNAIIEGANRDKANFVCAAYMRENFGIWGGREPPG